MNDDRFPWGKPDHRPDLSDTISHVKQRWSHRNGGGGFNSFRPGGRGVVSILAVIFIGWLMTGIFTVDEQEQAVVLQLGKFHSTRGPGFHIRLPNPIQSHEIVAVNVIRREEVGNLLSESRMLTGDENIVELEYTVFWKVNNPQYFLFNVKDPEATLRLVAESAMREVVGKRDLQPIITTGRDEVQAATLELIQKTLDSYNAGILITEVNIARADPPEPVQEVFRDVVNAAQDKQKKINEATAYANDIVPRARGEAQKILQEAEAYRESEIARAQGEADRFDSIYAEYSKSPQVTRERMFLETMERVLSRSDQILLDNDAGAITYLPLDMLRKKEQR